MIVIYIKDDCSFCTKAKRILNQKSIPYREINVDHDLKALEFLKAQNHKTVPQIYYDDYLNSHAKIFVTGGYEGLITLTDNELAQKLEQVY